LKDFDGNDKKKTVFVLVFQEGFHLRDRITKVCQSSQAKIFALPDNGQRGLDPFKRMIKEIRSKVTSMAQLIELTEKQMAEYLSGIQTVDDFPGISASLFHVQFLRREKSIFHCLNMLSRQGQIVQGYVWTSLTKQEFLDAFYGPEVNLLSEAEEHSPRNYSLQVEEVRSDKLNPPTLFRTNEFTKYFQMLVDNYAIPSYKEINPAVYSIVSFPFLFGVMYGDVGHGSVLLAASLFLMAFGRGLATRFETFKEVFEFRYMLFLMAFFSVYCGLMYNDFMSLPLNLFNSCYNAETGIRKDPQCVYPVGIDPIWYGTK